MSNMRTYHLKHLYPQGYIQWFLVVVISSAVVLLCAILSCATNPVSKKKEFVLMSEEQELSIGRQMAPQIEKEYGVYASSQLQEYISALGERIAGISHRPDIFFHFTVLDSPIVNAFALPGGYIYITRGLLAHMNSESELAGVLSHEVAHVTARHAVRQYTKAASYQVGTGIASIFFPEISGGMGQFADLAFLAILNGYSREFETEADSLAVTYTTKAGYDPQAMALLLQTLELLDRYRSGKKTYTSLFATHPSTDKRIAAVEAALSDPKIKQLETLKVNKEAFLQAIDGLTFGKDVQAGVVYGNRFQHPDFRIEFFFPQNWAIENKPDAVIATHPDRQYQIILRIHYLTKKISLEQAAHRIAQKNGFKPVSGSSQQINNLESYTGTYEGRLRSSGYVYARIGFYLQKDKVYYVTGVAPLEEFNSALPFFEKTIESFRELSPQEAQQITPTRVRRHTVKRGETLEGILQSLNRASDERKTIALLNAWDPENIPELTPGMVIKVLSNE